MDARNVEVIGIDPGSVTGVVWLRLPAGARGLDSASLAGSFFVSTPAARKGEAEAELQRRWLDKLTTVLGLKLGEAWPDVVVLEEPLDGMPSWSKAGRGTSFALGRNYMAAIAAVSALWPTRRLVSYLVVGSKRRAGWMPKLPGKPHFAQKRELTLSQLETDWRRIGGRGDVTEHELMALGVARYHVASEDVGSFYGTGEDE